MGRFIPDQPEKVLHCYHCGNKTLMKRIADHWEPDSKIEFVDIDYETGEDIVVTVDFEDQWNLYRCPVCHQVTLEHLSWNSEYSWDWRDTLSEEILYPKVEIKSEFFPEDIRREFEKLLKAKDNEKRIMHMRKIIESICEDKGAEGRNLEEQIKDLSKKGVLPPVLKEASDLLRKLGNLTVHPYEVEFKDKIVDNAFDWLSVILNYVYVLPSEVASLKPKIEKMREEAEEKKKVEKKNKAEKNKE